MHTQVARPSFYAQLLHEHTVLTSLAGCSGVLEAVALLGEDDGGPAILMRPIGAALSLEVIHEQPRFHKAVPLLVEVLQRCHELGWVHRDLRPDNLVLMDKQPDVEVVIIDW